MKVLEFKELEAEDSLRLTFTGTFDPQVSWERELEPFFQVLEAHADAWMPDVVEGKRRRRYTRRISPVRRHGSRRPAPTPTFGRTWTSPPCFAP
jgi:hypothetical protein